MSEDNALYWEDVEEGLEVRSPARTVTESDIVNFAGLSGDFNIIHTDAEFSKGTPFGQRIAHGVLGLSIATGLVARNPGAEQHRLIAFLGMTWDFRNPVFIGDTVHVEQKVVSKRRIKQPGLGIVEFEAKVVKQTGEICQEGIWKVLYMCRTVE